MFLYPTFIVIYNQILQDLRNGGFVVLPKSVLAVLAYAFAAIAYLWFQYLSAVARDAIPYTAEAPFLDAWASLKGVNRKDATAANGVVSFGGVVSTIVPSGTNVVRSDGFTYTTTANFAIGNTSSVGIVAATTGSAGNAPAGTLIQMGTTIQGVNSIVNLIGGITGGSDLETDDSLRTRMLLAYQKPPQGGSSEDYVEWSLAVPGVTRAWCAGSQPGAGDVSVFVMFDEAEATSNVSTSGFPVGTNGTATDETRGTGAASGDQLLVANYIYPLRPVTALVYVFAPQPYLLNTVVTGLGVVSSDTQSAIANSLSNLYLSIGSPLATTVAPSQIYGAINAVVPLDSFDLISPSTVVTIPYGYLPVVGTATYS